MGEWGSGTPGEILPSTKWGESGVGVKLSGGDAVNSFTCGGYVVKLSGIRGDDTYHQVGGSGGVVSVGVGELFS